MTSIKLSTPVEYNGVTYAELNFRHATIGDFMAGDAVSGEMSKTIAVLASISDTPLPAMKKIRAKDLVAIMTATAELLGNEPVPSITP